ncbi:bifunctional tRNA (5-methylaminomethyl-2-thiouridine)(34)-methyltransferase MnmD/FAD-dependent 5-carboxymethylaminomethyl-2-thiouridine(34) oxidoreductase MnmC [Providencia rettgeri]|uniref:bifunctional tRNA (5-methylaminomethyl-2-thiouridine)(34)-methyltransferase MnmD/FAD-dependent 5-carboxymethylaminomethyl-2-thiouridine(34) oxidoreductase MnmC n=1 Tax=Providencia TaxID=586 RepID=UPI00227694BA|nr:MULTISPECIES: bifunctional tRNA (5-methylaminomethyl-2-thiouridine)(34)-methyltransferase MnmD/FAD-dependent 5-carboxymethylaminomethyl-2-thiouridine(34) oxidoreductase MnmC [unclassified Providencia]MDB9566702.1 bifunctional tRNA (5-methylaminomethyl-2-thiouridine)(34)-methyltransferase MnmD/FAD-dependent 5-carboxymethylaminomethyl-2-thiouridine(34) oxidoreductase MnmC [Providencia rettgeri]WOB92486.1 bifunctional tRNA (5-methylaminomethyl-2-thiouridine)(34)-methyltransferase MnmD/FAD-depende
MKKNAVQTARLSWNDEGTPMSEQFADIYFSNQDGLEEARHVFLQGNHFPERFATHPFTTCVIAETGFGTGLNFLALWQSFKQFKAENPNAKLQQLHFISFEKYPLTQSDLMTAHQCWPELSSFSQSLCENWPQALPGNQRIMLENGSVILDLWFGDVNEQISLLKNNLNNKIDAWFLDGFAPSKNPEMWSEQLFTNMAKFARLNGTFATFTVAGSVKRGLQQASFTLKKVKGFGNKREMLTGVLAEKEIDIPTPWFARKSADNPTDVAIIGGGLASLTAAYALHNRGAKVTLYCQDTQVAQNASGNRQGAIYPLLTGNNDPLERFFVSAFPFASRFYHQLAKQGLSFEGQWCGVSQLAYNDKVARKIAGMLGTEWPADFAIGKSRQQLSGICGVDVNHDGIHYASGGWLCPAQLCESLQQYLQQLGITFCFEHNVVELKQTEQDWQLLIETAQHKQLTRVHSTVIIANGHKLRQFAQTVNLPISPVRGQVSHIPTNHTLQQLKNVLCFEGYLTPADATGTQHCLGASYQRERLDFDYSEEEQQGNRQKLVDNLPDVTWPKDIDISQQRSRQGIRCVIRDHFPLLGNVPDFEQHVALYHNLPTQIAKEQPIALAPVHPNLFIFGALGSRGLSTAPLCAELLAAQIFGEVLPLDDETLAELNPNRFWVRKLLLGRPIKLPY